jgi:hypothetical protein
MGTETVCGSGSAGGAEGRGVWYTFFGTLLLLTHPIARARGLNIKVRQKARRAVGAATAPLPLPSEAQ